MIAKENIDAGEMDFTMAKVTIANGVIVTMMHRAIFVLGVTVFTIQKVISCTLINGSIYESYIEFKLAIIAGWR